MKLRPYGIGVLLGFCTLIAYDVVVQMFYPAYLASSLPISLVVIFALIVVGILGNKKWGEYRPPPSAVQPGRLSVAATRLGLVLVAVGLGWLFLNVALAALALTIVLTGTLFEIDFGVAIIGVAFTYAGRYLSYSIPFSRLVAYSFSRHRPADEE